MGHVVGGVSNITDTSLSVWTKKTVDACCVYPSPSAPSPWSIALVAQTLPVPVALFPGPCLVPSVFVWRHLLNSDALCPCIILNSSFLSLFNFHLTGIIFLFLPSPIYLCLVFVFARGVKLLDKEAELTKVIQWSVLGKPTCGIVSWFIPAFSRLSSFPFFR